MSISSHTPSLVTSNSAEAIWFTGCLALIKASTESTGGVLGLVEFVHPPDFATPPHIHHAEDEAFYVLEGAMNGFCGDEKWRATTGDFVWLPRGIPHGYSVDSEVLRTLAITVPTGPQLAPVRMSGARRPVGRRARNEQHRADKPRPTREKRELVAEPLERHDDLRTSLRALPARRCGEDSNRPARRRVDRPARSRAGARRASVG